MSWTNMLQWNWNYRGQIIHLISLHLCELFTISPLEKVYYKTKPGKSFKAYEKQKNFCSRLYKKTKRFFNHFNLSFFTDNKLFLKMIKPFFSSKGNYGSQIKLVEKAEVFQDDDLIAKELNKCFQNALSTLNTKEIRFVTNRS